MNRAIIIGATGLTGKNLLKLLLADEAYSVVKIFTRRTTGMQHPKLEEHIINFDAPQEWKSFVTGDVLFSALGTTLKKAGSKEAQYKIDYTYQYNFAHYAAENGVPTYVLVSSASANAHSKFFYMRIKGALERDVKGLRFNRIIIIQPGPLEGEREESRLAEKISIATLRLLNRFGILKKYRPISGKTVAKAMINAAQTNTSAIETYSLLQLFSLAKESPQK